AAFASALFTADGARLVALENGQPAILRRWETATGKELATRQVAQPYSHGGRLVAFTPDGKGLVGKGDKSIHLWDLATGKLLREFKWPAERLRYVALSPDGKTLAASGYTTSFKVGRSVLLWDVATGKPLPAIGEHEEGVYCVAFAQDGKTLLT